MLPYIRTNAEAPRENTPILHVREGQSAEIMQNLPSGKGASIAYLSPDEKGGEQMEEEHDIGQSGVNVVANVKNTSGGADPLSNVARTHRPLDKVEASTDSPATTLSVAERVRQRFHSLKLGEYENEDDASAPNSRIPVDVADEPGTPRQNDLKPPAECPSFCSMHGPL